MSAQRMLLAVPNISEGRERTTVAKVQEAFTAGGAARLLDVHSDPDHHRSVLTLAGVPGALSRALVAGVREAVRLIDVGEQRSEEQIGQHPHVGAVDVVPLVYLDAERRGAACAEALVVAEEIGRLGVPVFLYGELAQGRSRAELRTGGVRELARRMRAGELRADFGPDEMHSTAGATLVASREPLVAFNLELSPPATVADARRIAAAIREGGPMGLPGVRAIGVALGERGSTGAGVDRTVAQVSMNIERPLEVPLCEVVRAVRKCAPVSAAELVGVAPAAALEGFPEDLEMPGFDAAVHVIENALGF